MINRDTIPNYDNAIAGFSGDQSTALIYMLDAMPMACALLDDHFQPFDCNLETVKLTGLSSKEEYCARRHTLMPELQPDGTDSRIKMQEILNKAMENGRAVADFTYRLPNGEKLPAELTATRIPWKGKACLALFVRDLRKIKTAESRLEGKNRLLETINAIAGDLLHAKQADFDNALIRSLGIMGRSVNTDRVHLWENFEQNGKLYARRIYEWSEHPVFRRDTSSTFYIDYERVPHWKTQMFSGRMVNSPVQALPEQERRILQLQNIQSILVIPIISEEGFSGFIGFDDCSRQRFFSEMEAQVLLSGGLLIASAISRYQFMEAMELGNHQLLKHRKLLMAVSKVATSILGEEQGDFSRLIQTCLQILGESVGAVRVSIWRNYEDGQGELCSRRLPGWGLEESLERQRQNIVLKYKRFIPEWDEATHATDYINVPSHVLDQAAMELSQLYRGESLLLLTLYIQGRFWGFVAFAHNESEYRFSKEERDILRSGCMMIASAVVRNDMTQKLLRTREQALAGTHAKSEFLSRMSHEMRTPLNAIIGMSAIAGRADDVEKLRYCFQKIETASRQLLNIINDVLDISKIEEGKFELSIHEMDLEKVLENAITVVGVRIEQKYQELRLELEDVFAHRLRSDEVRLTQVIINLLSNASKFTGEYGSITLKVSDPTMAKDRSRLRFEVEDNGIGIAPEQQKNLFQVFEQADGGKARRHEGSGLGLAICRKIIHLMGGEIWLYSQLGKGSRFVFEIPAQWGEPLANAGLTLAGPLRVLVVTHDDGRRRHLETILRTFCIDCGVAAEGHEAYGRVREAQEKANPYNLILLDWDMPGMNGGETAEKIRSISRESRIVMMTARQQRALVEQETGRYDIAGYLHKPVLPSALINTILDLMAPPSYPREPESSSHLDWSQKRVLIVEDIAINREIAVALLEDTGIQVDCAADGEQAVNLVRSGHAYDIILMDIQLPILDGLEATRQIRQMPGGQQVPIVAMTANAFRENVRECLDAGMNDHLAKPVDASNLIGILARYLEE